MAQFKKKKPNQIPAKAQVMISLALFDPNTQKKRIVTGFVAPVYYRHDHEFIKAYRFYEDNFICNEVTLLQDPEETQKILEMAKNNTLELENLTYINVVHAKVFRFHHNIDAIPRSYKHW